MTLQIEELTVRYPRQATATLGGLSVAVAKGERVAIVGPSGTGKTTLFRAIGGFVGVESGRIRLAGEDVAGARGKKLRALRRRIAWISQRHDLVERLRVHQNVTAG